MVGDCTKIRQSVVERAALEALPSPWRPIEEIADRLRAEHFAGAHTDMVGDAEYRAGYLDGIKALADALRMPLPEPPK